MKNLKLSLLILFLLTSTYQDIYSAEYLGENIDNTEYDCTAYSYSTGNYYYVTVEFSGDEATITFSNGGYITVTLDNEVIDDPSSISAYDYNKSVFWELNVDGLD
jgi:hypothetical protein